MAQKYRPEATDPYLATEHSYTIPKYDTPWQEVEKGPPNVGEEPVRQVSPHDNSGVAKAEKTIPDFLGNDWGGLHNKKTSHLTVGSLNVEGMGRCKKTQIADMCDTLDMDILATIEHYKDDTEFRGSSYKNYGT